MNRVYFQNLLNLNKLRIYIGGASHEPKRRRNYMKELSRFPDSCQFVTYKKRKGKSKMKQINFKALAHLKEHREQITKQQFATLRGQIFSGNADGAMKGLRKLLKPN